MRSYFPLKGRAGKSGEHIIFDITDAPFRITETQLVLRERPGSCFVELDSIGRCSDLHSIEGEIIAEGDKIISGDNPKEYFVKWINGFKAVTANDDPIPLQDVPLPRVVGRYANPNVRKYLFYSAKGIQWNLFDITGFDSVNKKIQLNRRDLYEADIVDIQQVFMCRNIKVILDSVITLKDGRMARTCLHFGNLCFYVDGIYMPYNEKQILQN